MVSLNRDKNKNIMSLDIYFVYETEDKDKLEVKEFGVRGLMSFLEYFPHAGTPEEIEQFKNSVLFPTFVKDFATPEESENQNIEDMSEEEWEEMLEPYVGPTFEAQELVSWMTTWIEIIESDEEARRALIPLTEYGYDWAPSVIEDMKQIIEQGKCAQLHNVKMHIEMY
jgi:hypothetical protein